MIPWGWPSSEWHQPAGDSSDSPVKEETVSEAPVATSGLSSSIHTGSGGQLNRVCVCSPWVPAGRPLQEGTTKFWSRGSLGHSTILSPEGRE